MTATREIAKYITQAHKGAGKFLTAMDPNTLLFKVLVEPVMTPPPNGAGIAIIEVWKLSLKCYSDWMVQ